MYLGRKRRGKEGRKRLANTKENGKGVLPSGRERKSGTERRGSKMGPSRSGSEEGSRFGRCLSPSSLSLPLLTAWRQPDRTDGADQVFRMQPKHKSTQNVISQVLAKRWF